MNSPARCHVTQVLRWLVVAAAPMLMLLPAVAAKPAYLLVDNYTGKNILRYDLSTGAFVDELVSAGTGGLGNPTGMTIGADGSLYVTSYTDSRHGSVLRFNAHTGRFQGVFASVPGNSIPMEPAFGPDGDLYVSDYQNKVFRFDGVTGASLGAFASGGRRDSFRDLAWGPDGNLYVANFNGGRVDRFDGHTGALIGSLGSPHTRTADDLAFGPDGLLYVSQYWSRGVDAYDPTTGALVKSLDSTQLSDSNGLVFDAQGRLYVTSLFANTIVKFDGDKGSLFTQGSPLSNPQDMVITTAVPEPATLALLLAGMAVTGVAGARRRSAATAGSRRADGAQTLPDAPEESMMSQIPRTHAKSAARWLLVAALSAVCAQPASAAKQEYLLVSNREGENILRYDLATGAYAGVAVKKGAGGMSTPYGLTMGPDGYLYVAGWNTEHSAPDPRVLKFDPRNGKFLGTFASSPDMKAPVDVSFGPDGNLYVSDGYNKIFRFDGTTGASMGTFASVTAPGNTFRGSAWGPDGNLYAAQFWGGVARFDGHTGQLIDVMAVAQTSNPMFNTFGADGLMYLSDYWGGGIDVYDPRTGSYVKSLQSGSMSWPVGVIFDDKGDLYAAGYASNAIVKFAGDSGSVFTQGRPMNGPIDMVITTAVPEPATLALLVAGLAVTAVASARRRSAASGG